MYLDHFFVRDGILICKEHTDEPARRLVSRTQVNPGRVFWKCTKPLPPDSRHFAFAWEDELPVDLQNNTPFSQPQWSQSLSQSQSLPNMPTPVRRPAQSLSRVPTLEEEPLNNLQQPSFLSQQYRLPFTSQKAEPTTSRFRPATLQTKNLKDKEIVDLSNLDADIDAFTPTNDAAPQPQEWDTDSDLMDDRFLNDIPEDMLSPQKPNASAQDSRTAGPVTPPRERWNSSNITPPQSRPQHGKRSNDDYLASPSKSRRRLGESTTPQLSPPTIPLSGPSTKPPTSDADSESSEDEDGLVNAARGYKRRVREKARQRRKSVERENELLRIEVKSLQRKLLAREQSLKAKSRRIEELTKGKADI